MLLPPPVGKMANDERLSSSRVTTSACPPRNSVKPKTSLSSRFAWGKPLRAVSLATAGMATSLFGTTSENRAVHRYCTDVHKWYDSSCQDSAKWPWKKFL